MAQKWLFVAKRIIVFIVLLVAVVFVSETFFHWKWQLFSDYAILVGVALVLIMGFCLEMYRFNNELDHRIELSREINDELN